MSPRTLIYLISLLLLPWFGCNGPAELDPVECECDRGFTCHVEPNGKCVAVRDGADAGPGMDAAADSGMAQAPCGDGTQDALEDCDDGNMRDGDGCSSKCVRERCGDGIIQRGMGEACDDNNAANGDGCSSTCQLESMGCSVVAALVCDMSLNGSTSSANATSALSTYACVSWNESGSEETYELTAPMNGEVTVSITADRADLDVFILPRGAGACDPQSCSSYGDTVATFPVIAGERYYVVVDGYEGAAGDYSIQVACNHGGASCGNSLVDTGEDCDDGNIVSGDGCSMYCTFEGYCGDGFIGIGEDCDDANSDRGDGCSPSCEIERCGDGTVQVALGEDCDDGNTSGGDGCSSTCTTEAASCVPAFNLTCGSSDTWNTGLSGSTNALMTYSCVSWSETGREYAYRFVAPQSGMITVSIGGLVNDLDLFVLSGSGCSASGCVAYGDTSASFNAFAGETYYFVVDGHMGAVGPYSINVSCPATGPVCGDFSRTGSEECDDGNTMSGDGCSSTCQIEAPVCVSYTIACGGSDTWDTTMAGTTDIMNSYSCTSWTEDGSELVYELYSQFTQSVTVELTGLATDVDVFVLSEGIGGGCSPQDCIAFGNMSVSFTAFAGSTYFLVADSPGGQGGPYTLGVTCTP